MGVTAALSIVYASVIVWMNREDREDFEGWMTCTYEQAIDFLGDQKREDMAERLRVAQMIGGG